MQPIITVAATAAILAGVDPDVIRLLSANGESRFVEPLSTLIKRHGEDVDRWFRYGPSVGGRAMIFNGTVLVVLDPGMTVVPGDSIVQFILLDLKGRPLDRAKVEVGTRHGVLSPESPSPSGWDGKIEVVYTPMVPKPASRNEATFSGPATITKSGEEIEMDRIRLLEGAPGSGKVVCIVGTIDRKIKFIHPDFNEN